MADYPPPRNILPIFNEEEHEFHLDGLSISEADSRYLRLTGGALSGSLTINELSLSDSTISFSGTTGNNIISVVDNLADALSIKEGANSYFTIDTTNSAEQINLKKNTDITGNLTISGSVAGLTQAELTQLANIDSTTISTTQWGYLGGLNQDLRTNQDVDFARINTGQGYHEIYATEQALTPLSNPTFNYVILTKGYRNPNSGGLKSTATQSIADNTSTLVTWNTTEWDSQIPSVIGASNDLVAGRQAIYQVNAQICFDANATGKRSLCIFLNGGNIRCVEMNALSGTDPTFLNISFQIELNVNDALTCYVYQNSGGNLNIGDASLAIRQSYFQMSYLGFDDVPI